LTVGTPSAYSRSTVTRKGTQLRADLTAAEWRKVQNRAKRERLSASQLVGRYVREGLARGDAELPTGAILVDASGPGAARPARPTRSAAAS